MQAESGVACCCHLSGPDHRHHLSIFFVDCRRLSTQALVIDSSSPGMTVGRETGRLIGS